MPGVNISITEIWPHKLRRLSTLPVFFAVALGLLSLAAPRAVFASDSLAQGCALYNSAHYKQAQPLLQDAVRRKPGDWTGHYYLANTYLELGQRTLATTEYRICLGCHPSAQVAAACQRVIYEMYNESGLRHTGGSSSSGRSTHVVDSQDDLDRRKRLEVERERILKDANQQAERVRAETASANAAAVRNSNVRAIYRDTIPAVDPEYARSLQEAENAKIKAINDRAQHEIQGLR